MSIFEKFDEIYSRKISGLDKCIPASSSQMQALTIQSAVEAFEEPGSSHIEVLDLKLLVDLLEKDHNEFIDRMHEHYNEKANN